MRALIIAALGGLATATAIAQTGPYFEPREEFLERNLKGYGPAYVRNQWGGVVTCNLSRNPLATSRMRRYCAGRYDPSSDPARFDCSTAETDSEFGYCRGRK